MIAHVRIVKASFFLFFFLFGILVPAAASAEAWLQELLKEREQKDGEFKTSLTSPMAGSERLILSGPDRKFIAIRGGAVVADAQAGAGTVFAVFSREEKWYWDGAVAGITCSLAERDIAQRLAMSEADLYRKQRLAIEEVARTLSEMEARDLAQPAPVGPSAEN